MPKKTEPVTASQTDRVAIIKSKVGYVVSDKMDKTLIVRVETFGTHRLYKKRLKKSKRFQVHDEANTGRMGDFVRIVEGRPRSKTKSWQLSDVLRAANAQAVQAEQSANESPEVEA